MTEATRKIDAELHLLDRQVLDCDGAPTSTVDDLELAGIEWEQAIDHDADPPTIEALLSGPVVLNRIFGGRPPSSKLYRFEWGLLAKIGTALELKVAAETLEVGWPERWVREHIIARIPGGDHAPE